MIDDFLQELADTGQVQFYVRARPGMPLTKFVERLSDGSLKINIAAPPEGGRANKALLKFLAQKFEVSIAQVDIVSGATARHKLVRVTQ